MPNRNLFRDATRNLLTHSGVMSDDEALVHLAGVIRSEIAAAGGAIPFSRFMERALYSPRLGYYERPSCVIGRDGDFMTSVSVGPLFGELLASQFNAWAGQLTGTRGPFHIVESGAHDGRLAFDILASLQQLRPTFFERLAYVILEPSPAREARQRELLGRFAPHISWATSWAEVGQPVNGVIFANELLDAFPVVRLIWDPHALRWTEQGVTTGPTGFSWTGYRTVANWQAEEWLGQPLPAELLAVLPAGFTLDLAPGATAWWAEAARRLESGRLVTIDYALGADEMITPRHASGTLRGYRQHRVTTDVLDIPGSQDLTAHVNYTALTAAGAGAGLTTEFNSTQYRFLSELVMKPGISLSPSEWTPARLRQFQTLTHPEHLGRAFRVLIQRRVLPGVQTSMPGQPAKA